MANPTDIIPQGTELVAAIGMFDGVHLGHLTLLDAVKREAAARGMASAVFTFKQHPRQVLHPEHEVKMLMSLSDKLQTISQQGIDYIVPLEFTHELSQLSALEFMRMLHTYGVKVLLMGYNHRFGHDRSSSFADYVRWGTELGIDVVKAPEYLGQYAPVSSSIIRNLITAGKVDDALRCMGRPYSLSGHVVHGFRNGTALGFPTANVGEVAPDALIPHNGAYAVMVLLKGKWWQGMVNVGYRPTLSEGKRLSIEVNVFDFEGDVYGEPITLQFIQFLRLEFKMVSIDELRHQLELDRDKARAILKAYSQ